MRDTIVYSALEDAVSLLAKFMADEQAQAAVAELVDKLADCFKGGGKVLLAGNGGSLADAMHFAEEWTGRFRSDRRPYPAMALADPTHLTCVANDYGFEHVFSRSIEAFAKPGDLVILLTTSGQSKNLILAADAAKAAGAFTVGFLGRGGGSLVQKCDLALHFPGSGSDRIQELHMLTMHAVIDAVERRLEPGIAD
jgi:D-sedoheptulose 7-phosphate isomerase